MLVLKLIQLVEGFPESTITKTICKVNLSISRAVLMVKKISVSPMLGLT